MDGAYRIDWKAGKISKHLYEQYKDAFDEASRAGIITPIGMKADTISSGNTVVDRNWYFHWIYNEEKEP